MWTTPFMLGFYYWRLVLEPVIARYRGRSVALYFRADAAFAKPEIYWIVSNV